MADSFDNANAFSFAIKNATTEGKITMCCLLVLSLFSWTIIITKARQLMIAREWAKQFFAACNESRDPMDIRRKGESFEGAPAYQLYIRGADEVVEYQKMVRVLDVLHQLEITKVGMFTR